MSFLAELYYDSEYFVPRRCYLLHAEYWRRRLRCLEDLLLYSKSTGALKAVSAIGELTKKVQHISLHSTTIIYFAVAFGCSWHRTETQCARQCGNTEQSYSLLQKVHNKYNSMLLKALFLMYIEYLPIPTLQYFIVES